MKTTNLEISKKLEKAGFSRQPFWIWTSEQCCAPYQTNYDGFRSYDLETLLDAFPKETEIRISNLTKERIFYLDSWWKNIRGNEASIAIEDNESLADTAGKMWLLLKERGLIC